MKLYHGTTERVARLSLTQGLRPRIDTGESNWKHTVESNENMIYLSSAYAPYFGFMTVNDYHKEKFGIIEVETDELQEHLLYPDEDFIEQATRSDPSRLGIKGKTMHARTKWIRNHLENFQPNWKMAVEKMGNCCYGSVIHPHAITRVVVIEPSKCKSMCGEAMQPTITLANFMVAANFYKTLTRWFMGDTITFEDWTRKGISQGLELQLFSKEQLADYTKKRNESLRNQTGIERIK